MILTVRVKINEMKAKKVIHKPPLLLPTMTMVLFFGLQQTSGAQVLEKLNDLKSALGETLSEATQNATDQASGAAADVDALVKKGSQAVSEAMNLGDQGNDEKPIWQQLYDDASSAVSGAVTDLARTVYLLNETENERLVSIREKIDKIRIVLDEYLELETAERKASSFTIISKSKKDYEIAQHTLLSEIQSQIFRDEITDHSDQYYNTIKVLKKVRDDISRANEGVLLGSEKAGLFQKTKEDFKKEKAELELMEVSLMRLLDRLEMDLMLKFKLLGSELSRGQVRSLLVRIDGNDIAESMALFSVTRDITEKLSELVVAESTSADEAVKYYGMYVLLAELMLKLNLDHQARIETQYADTLAQIREETKESIEDSEEILERTTAASSKSIVRQNLRNMRLVLTVLEAYETVLKQRNGRLQESIEKNREVLAVAYSTYDTAASSANLINFMSATQTQFDQIFSLQLPDMIEFDNSDLQSAFEKVSAEMQARML